MTEVTKLGNNNADNWWRQAKLPQYQNITKSVWEGLQYVRDLEVFEKNGISTQYGQTIRAYDKKIAHFAFATIALLTFSLCILAGSRVPTLAPQTSLLAWRFSVGFATAAAITTMFSLVFCYARKQLRNKELDDEDRAEIKELMAADFEAIKEIFEETIANNHKQSKLYSEWLEKLQHAAKNELSHLIQEKKPLDQSI